MPRRFLVAVLAFVPALALTACSPPQAGSLIAPTIEPAGVSPAQTAPFQTTSVGPVESGVVEASIVITGLVSGTACPTLRFSVSSYTFSTSADTRYENGSCADLRAGSSITFAGTRNTDNQSVFRVSRITFPASTTARPTTPAPTTPSTSETVNVAGTVERVISGSACPNVYFTIAGSYTFIVTSTTVFQNGTCASVRVGARVRAAGTVRNDGVGVIQVSRLEVLEAEQTPTTTPTITRPPEPPVEAVSGEGVVASLVQGTACPTLNFMIGPYTLMVSATTRFEGGTCADITPGLRVTVTGVRQGDGTLALSAIAFRIETPARQNEVEGEGAVTGVVGTTACPTLQVRIGEYTLNVDASTEYVTESCAGIAVGRVLGVRGVVVGEKTVRATRITFRN